MTTTVDLVVTALQRSTTTDDRIELVSAAAEWPALAGLGDALDVLRLTVRFELSNADLDWDTEQVVLTGTGSFGLPGAAPALFVAVRATLRYTNADARDNFTLELDLPAAWTFGDTFGDSLPRSRMLVGQTIRYEPSYLTDLPISGAILAAEAIEGTTPNLRLRGDLPLSPLLEPYADFFGSWPLPLHGPMTLPEGVTRSPDFSLVATSNREPITTGPIALSGFGFELICDSAQDVTEDEPFTVLNAVADLALGRDPAVTGRASIPLLTAWSVWRVLVDFGDTGPTLGDGFAGIARALGLPGAGDFVAPPGVRTLADFRFAQLEAGVVQKPPNGIVPRHVAVNLVSDHTWITPVPFLTVTQLSMGWLIGLADGLKPRYLVGTFAGRMRFATGSDPDEFVMLDVTAAYPTFAITAVLTEGEIPLEAVLRNFLGVPSPHPGDDLVVRRLRIEADVATRTLHANAWLTKALTFDLVGDLRITLVGVGVWITVSQNSVAGGLSGEFALSGMEPPGAPVPRLELSAQYQRDEWVLAGGLTSGSVVDLLELVRHFTGTRPLDDFDLLLRRLSASFSTGTGAFTFAGEVASRWTPKVLNGLTIAAAASVDIARAGTQTPATATLTGRFQVARFAVSIGVNLTAAEITYVFQVAFGDRWISAEVGWIGQDEDRHQVITIHIGDMTIGELIEDLVALVAPTLGFRLEPPWDILGRVNLSRFRLVIDPTLTTVEVTYQATIPLPTMTLTGIGLRASRVNGKPTVVMVLHRADSEPLSWDLLGGSPPAVAGEGKSLLRLDYLGLGQRIRLKGAAPATLREAIARLANDLVPPADPDQNPLRQSGARMEFAPEGGWLVGLDLTVAETVQVALLLLDPQLYGLAVGLRGDKAKAFAGLRFDVLYRKVAGGTGVFRAELEVPEALRRLQLGPVSVTLGVLVVEVYTNGDFRVDLGFPHQGNFDRSFAFELLPFLGRGGLMFGKLNAATSGRVPAISNGTFSPVIELGVGFAVGIGKEFRAGVLSGGAYVEVIAVFDGVFAWFNPTGSTAATDVYHWVNALAAVHGKLYAQIDLTVLKLAVTVEVWAEANVILEAYRATDIQLAARVEVNAELTIGTFTIPLSFADDVDFAFTVGTDRPTPWLLSSGPDGRGQARLRTSIAAPLGRVPRRRLELLRRGQPALGEWRPDREVLTNAPQTARLNLVPAFSITNVPLTWSPPAPVNPDPQYRAALMLVAPTGNTGAARRFVEAFLRWAISAVAGSAGNDPDAVVTAAQLRLAAEQLDAPMSTDHPFWIDRLITFFHTNLGLEIAGEPGDAQSGAVLPLPPRLTLSCPQAGGPPHDLSSHQSVGPYYLWQAAAYAAGFSPTPPPAVPAPVDDPRQRRSYASYLFQDWCLMVAKAAVAAAIAALEHWPVLANDESLADIADRFPTATVSYLLRAGDTVDSVAAALGASPAELRYHNDDLEELLGTTAPNEPLILTFGVSPEGVAIDNATEPLRVTGGLPLGTIEYQIASGDSLSAIAARFSARPPATLFPGGLSDPLARDRQLLAGYAEFTVPALVYPNPDGLAPTMAAAVFFTRYHPLSEVESADWYLSALFDLNQTTITWGPGDPVPPRSDLLIPAGFNDAGRDRARRYVSLPGDTISSIARALALTQRWGTGTQGPHDWPGFRDKVRSVAGGVSVPETTTVPVLPRESVDDLANRLITTAGDVVTLMRYVGEAEILAPLAILPVPAVTVYARGRSLAATGEQLGLSVEDLAGRLEIEVLFPADSRLTVAHVPVLEIDRLVERVLDENADALCARASRSLLSGTRLPEPRDTDDRIEATGPLTALGDLTGQQFPAPVADGSRRDVVALELTATVNPGASGWITLATSPLTFRYTNADLLQRYPADALCVIPAQVAAPLPAVEAMPRTYGLDHRIELQTPVALPLPPAALDAAAPPDAPVPVGASVWSLPRQLIDYVRAHPGVRFDVIRSLRRPDAPGKPELLPGTTFAALIPLRIHRIAGVRHRYELVGVDGSARQPLLNLWLRLATGDVGTRLFLATRPAPDAGHRTGLAVLDAAAARTFIVRVNQSTQTAPPAAGAATLGADFANLGQPGAFLRLLWEGSVVGGAGYAVGFATSSGADLPPAAFNDDGVAELALLALTGEEQQPAPPPGRPMHDYETCVVIPAGLDASVTTLWLEAADDHDVTIEPTLPPGTAGFGITLTPPAAGDDPNDRLLRTFSLVRYAVPNSPFQLADAGLPIGPLADDGQRLAPWRRARRDRRRRAGRVVPREVAADLWRYEQVLPLHRLGPTSPCPDVPGLPVPGADPYRGLGHLARVHLGLSDGLGNISTLPGGPNGTVELPMVWNDAVLGLGGWPGLTTAYWVDRGPTGVRLRVNLAIQPATTMPALDGTALTSAPVAARAAQRYARAYYQLSAGRLEAAVMTSLRPGPHGEPSMLPVDASALWRLAAAGHLAASAAAAVTPVFAGVSIADIIDRYGVDAALIAAVNGDRPAVDILGSHPLVPAYQVIGEDESADEVIARLPVGWPRPTSGSDLLRLPHNATIRLRVGAVLKLAGASVTATPGSMEGIAAAYHTTPGLLADDNAPTAGIFEPSFVFEFEGVTIAAGTRSLADLVKEFGTYGVICDAASLGTANAGRAGIFRPGATLITKHYLARADDTIVDNDSSTDLTTHNGDTRAIFPPGTLVSLGLFDPGTVAVVGGETLVDYADRFGCPPGPLVAANAVRPLNGSPVLVPGAVRLPEPNRVRVPYSVRPRDTLDGVAALFPDCTALKLASDNAAMPGTLAPGLTVVVIIEGVLFDEDTVAGDSFDAVRQRLSQQDSRITLADVVQFIAGTPGFLAESARLATPAPRLPGSGALSPSAAGSAYGVDPLGLCLANAAVLGLIQPGVPLTVSGHAIVTGADDTFNSLTARFARLAPDTTVDISDIVEGNKTVEFLRGGVAVLLPAAPMAVAVSFAGAGPFNLATCPLTVAIRLHRPDSDPGSAQHADTAVPAQSMVDSSGGTPTRTLGAFATAFHAALPDLRLATGGTGQNADAELWLVNFGAGGLSSVVIERGTRLPDGTLAPRSFAIRPLYRVPQTRRQVPLLALDDAGQLMPGASADIQAVDVELWARRFLSDLDTVLSTSYACGLYDDPTARLALQSLLRSKDRLTIAIARGVAEVLRLPTPATPEQIEAAAAVIRDRLAIELAAGYDTAALVQYNTTVAWSTSAQAPPARLLGSPSPASKPAVPYQLTAAKTTLDEPRGYLTFPLSLADPPSQRAVAVDLDYTVTHLEHDIRVIDGSGGYPSSRWLTFYPPLDRPHRPTALRVELNSAQIPIPLRGYPALPSLVGQSADPTVVNPPDLDDVARWTYGVTYAHEHAAQDEVHLDITVNTTAPRRPSSMLNSDPVTALARYLAVADQLSDLLAAYGAADGDRARAANAAVSFAALAEEVAGTWLQHDWPAAERSAATDAVIYRYGITVSGRPAVDGAELLSTVHLRLQQAAPGPGDVWPDIEIRAADGTPVVLVAAQPGPDGRDYAVPGAVPRPAWLTLTLRWPGLHVVEFQNAQATLSVRRNAMLLGRPGPATNDAFVFQTADVTAPAPVSPLIVRQDPIDISSPSDVGIALTAALHAFTNATDDVRVSIAAWYGYEVAGAGATALRTRVPVALLADHPHDPDTGELVSEYLREWLGRNQVTDVPGRQWQFSITVHAGLDGAGERPLLVVDQLRYALFTRRFRDA